MTTSELLSQANHLFYTAVRNGRTDTIDTVAATIWWLVEKQVSAELAGQVQ